MTKNTTRKLRTLKGFQDFLPDEMRLRQYVINTFIKIFEKYGYEPLETPTLEYAETLLGISGDEAEKLFYRFKDNGGRDVMMRYEVMVPMCRVIAQYNNEITFPFKRYQIQRVWRAENTQKGRLREFTQCDADTIGTKSVIADAEYIQMGIEILQTFGFKDFYVQISNRKLLIGLMKEFGISDDNFYSVCMAVDKVRKIGIDGVVKILKEKEKLNGEISKTIVNVLLMQGTNEEKLQYFKSKYSKNKEIQEAIYETEEILNYLKVNEVNPDNYRFDPTISRGLAHYTGPVWEFEIKDGNIGSVAGCGRYDNIIGDYLGSDEQIPATGGSFGIERMMIVLKEQGLVDFITNKTQVLVSIFDSTTQDESFKMSKLLRDAGVNTLLYPDPNTRLDKQLKYASRKKIPLVLIIGPEEASHDEVAIKWMETGIQEIMGKKEAIEKIKNS